MNTVLLNDAKTMWVLIPHAVNADGDIVYKKCRVNKLVSKTNRWDDSNEILAVYADFVHDSNEGLATLKNCAG